MRARYLPPGSVKPVELDVLSGEEASDLLTNATEVHGAHRISAVEFSGDDGSVLVIGQARVGAVILWANPLGQTMHSVGRAGAEGTMIFDYFGSYTEVPAEFAVPLDLAHAVVGAFVDGKSIEATGLTLKPD